MKDGIRSGGYKIVLFVLIGLLAASVLSVSAAPPRRGVLGDVNHDGKVNSTDYMIILSADVGLLNVARFCPMNCGDVNGDGRVDSTDALIVMAYDVGWSVPYPVGVRWCPALVFQPPACIWTTPW